MQPKQLGSKYLLDIDGLQILIDCGLFRGLKELRLKNWEKFPVDVRQLDALVLTHAHMDHTGYLPKLVQEGWPYSAPPIPPLATY